MHAVQVIYTRAHTHAHTYAHTHTYTHTHTLHTHTYTHAHTHTCVCIYVGSLTSFHPRVQLFYTYVRGSIHRHILHSTRVLQTTPQHQLFHF